MKRQVLIVIGAALGVGFMVLALRQLDTNQIAHLFSLHPSWAWVAPAVGCYLLGHIVRGARCQSLVSREATLTLPVATNVVVLGYGVNNVLPARLGEFARAGALTELTGFPYVQSLTIAFAERLLDGIVIVTLLLVAAALLPVAPWISSMLPIAAGAFGVALTGIVIAISYPSYVLGLAARICLRLPETWRPFVIRQVESVLYGLAYLRNPRNALKVLFLSFGVWFMELGLFYFMLPACGLQLNFTLALLAMSVTNLAILIPSAPGYIGTFHFFCMQALVETGIGPETALSYAMLVHLGFYVPITTWGLGILLAYGFTLRKTLALSKMAVTLKNPEAEIELTGRNVPEAVSKLHVSRLAIEVTHSSKFFSALVGALLPLDDYFSSPIEKTEIARQTADFVQGQLVALPLRLRTMFAVGMIGFQILTWLRFLRGFTSLDPASQVAWAEACAYGRIGLLRQLLRPVRAPAILRFFELPQVLTQLQKNRPQDYTTEIQL